MNDANRAKVLSHAKELYPRECCGLLCIKNGEEVYYPCENISVDNQAFILSPFDFARINAISTIKAIVHSHCNEAAIPSAMDLVSCETTKLPWYIVSIPTETWHYWEPERYKVRLTGRDYVYGKFDCYSLVRDWYAENLPKVFLPERGDREWKCWESSANFFLDGFTALGFKLVEDSILREGDIILMQIASKVVDHIGVFTSPNVLFHHMVKCLSSRDVYGHYYRNCTKHVLRFEGLK